MTNRSTLPRWPFVALVLGFAALFILLGLWQ